eukprot:CAMPEP_0168584680 /NCGR_PEP_ID=MMETSP0420-20121227/3270_1 /TAXON_ID=498008 /ORGANISM="Pessonella sp." /LENGTH=216 /DNA_ID=CAMNT_0008619501 /DNA_START=264 /DNA_END=911 /DNA_ORIENTATION=+
MTQCALLLLLICGDDLSKVNKKAVIDGLKELQQENGSFGAVNLPDSVEQDIRFTYSAAVVSYILNDWSGFNKDLVEKNILNCQNYEGGFGQGPKVESHAGSTYCAVGTLALMNRPLSGARRQRCIEFLALRQGVGFQGRANKIEDTCYSFWAGASLKLLDAYEVIDFERLKSFVYSCQSDVGGIAKWPDIYADALHTYLPLCGLSVGGHKDLEPVS